MSDNPAATGTFWALLFLVVLALWACSDTMNRSNEAPRTTTCAESPACRALVADAQS